jgi:hypothetical protein
VAQDCTACQARRRRRENRPPQETPDVAAAAVRMVRGLGKRAAVDVEGLPFLVELAAVVQEELGRAVAGARKQEPPWSWADVGRALGIKRQSAQERFARYVEG